MDPRLSELIEEGGGNEEIEVILKLRPDDEVPTQVRIVARFGDIATCRLQRDRIRQTWEHPAVVSAKAPRYVTSEPEPVESAALAESDASFYDRRRPDVGVTGRGVVVGLLDWGCDFAHANFRKADGSTRLLALWDQADRTGDSPGPYGYGVVYSQQQIDRALRSSKPYQTLGYHPARSDPSGSGSHGTHVCDIAAGNGSAGGSVSGIAPEADIVFVNLAARGLGDLSNLGDSVRVLEALDFVARIAGRKPWVINLSLGQCGGPHTGLTLVEQGMDALLLQGPNRAIVQSTGNYFQDRTHAAGQLRPGQQHTLTWRTDKADRTPNELEIWYPGRDTLTVEVRPPGGEVVFRVALGEQRVLHIEGREVGRIYHRARDPGRGDNHVDLFLDPPAPAGGWRITLIGDDIVDGRFHSWVERDSACPGCQSRFDPQDAVSSSTTGTICNGFRTIAVGAYNPHSPERELAPFSSSGPAMDGRAKPDLLAPGVGILAARSTPWNASGASGALVRKSGTSMAAPHVTGCIALMLQAATRPLWISDIRRLLLSSAEPMRATGDASFRVGSGRLDIPAAVDAARRFGKKTRSHELRHLEAIMASPALFDNDPERDPLVPNPSEPADLGAGEVVEVEPSESEACAPDDAVWESGEPAGARLVDAADAAVSAGGAGGTAGGLLQILMADVADLASVPGGSQLSPHALFRALTPGAEHALGRQLGEVFEVVALPRSALEVELLPGDLLIRVSLGEPDVGHLAVITTGQLWTPEQLPGRRATAEARGPGWYAEIIEGGVRPHRREDGFARQVLDRDGRVPANQMVIRIRQPPEAIESMRSPRLMEVASAPVVPVRPARAVPSVALREAGANGQPVRARILWPALGFPAVIAPTDRPSRSPTFEVDATRCICVLVLSNRKYLSKEEAAGYLRYVPWAQRDRRHIPAGQTGSFAEVDLVVRNDEAGPRLVHPGPKDRLAQLVAFGGNKDGANAITVSLAHRVREFYRREGLEYLHEIRVSEEFSRRLRDGTDNLVRYNLFWNNEDSTEDRPSDEMELLLRRFARPRREALTGLWEKHQKFLLGEYEYEYGALQRPYRSELAMRRTRAEVLHPLFVGPPSKSMKIGHLTDTHVDVRADVYEENLKQARVAAPYNNWNTSFVNVYKAAKGDSDVLFLTGDLIDYGRGHWGLTAAQQLGDDRLYHVDRNWFLFYHLLASGDAYTRPVYTILGNHDWRLNPYPPFAIAGAPAPASLIHDSTQIKEEKQKKKQKEQQEEILRKAHGPGHEPKLSYTPLAETALVKKPGQTARQALGTLFLAKKTLDLPGFPTETTVESVAWYLLSINPFLDYWFTLPAGHKVLMLDWAEDENVQFGVIYQGKYYHSVGEEAAEEGPKARNCLTDLQRALVESFTEAPGAAKVIGIHAPPIGPWSDWYDDELALGWKAFDYGGRGYPHYSAKTADGKTMKGHPLFAIRPAKGIVPDAVYGMDASYNSFERHRPWFIKRVAEPRYGVRLVLSGHIHRKGLFVAYKAPPAFGEVVAGEMLIRSVSEKDVRGVRPPAGAHLKLPKTATEFAPAPGPLYVNGTSVGPRGHLYRTKDVKAYIDPGYALVELANDGTIQRVEFRWVRPTRSQPSTSVTPQQQAPLLAGRPAATRASEVGSSIKEVLMSPRAEQFRHLRSYPPESAFQPAFEQRPTSVVAAQLQEEQPELYGESAPWLQETEEEFTEETFEEELRDPPKKTKVPNTFNIPFRWICKVTIRKAGKYHHGGSGVLISDRHVLTAAHVVYDVHKNRAQYDLEVTPALDGNDDLGSYSSSGKPQIPALYDPEKPDYDYALITLDTAIGQKTFKNLKNDQLCFWGSPKCGSGTVLVHVDPKSLLTQTAYTAGYPKNKGASTMWCFSGLLVSVQEKTPTMSYTGEATEGQSGSPVWLQRDGQFRLVGVLVARGDVNIVVRVTPEFVRQLADWMGKKQKESPEEELAADLDRREWEQEGGEWEAEDEPLHVGEKLPRGESSEFVEETGGSTGLVLLDHMHVPKTPDPAHAGTFKVGSLTGLKTADMNPGFIDAADNLITDMSNSGLQRCLELSITTNFQGLLSLSKQTKPAAGDRVRVALVDLTGSKLTKPDFAGWGSTVAAEGRSSSKILALYAAFQLRSDLRELISRKSPADGADLEKQAKAEWKAKGLTTLLPNLQWLFNIKSWKPGATLDFSEAANKINIWYDCPVAELIVNVGFPYMGSVTWQSGLYHPTRGGLWLRASYCGKATWESPVASPFYANATALSAATFFTLLAQRRLVDDGSSVEIRDKLSRQCVSEFFPDGLPVVATKCGVWGGNWNDCVWIEDTEVRYVMAVMSRLATDKQGELYTKLCKELDALIRENNKSPGSRKICI